MSTRLQYCFFPMLQTAPQSSPMLLSAPFRSFFQGHNPLSFRAKHPCFFQSSLFLSTSALTTRAFASCCKQRLHRCHTFQAIPLTLKLFPNAPSALLLLPQGRLTSASSVQAARIQIKWIQGHAGWCKPFCSIILVFTFLVADIFFLTVFVESVASRTKQQQAASRAWAIPTSKTSETVFVRFVQTAFFHLSDTTLATPSIFRIHPLSYSPTKS